MKRFAFSSELIFTLAMCRLIRLLGVLGVMRFVFQNALADDLQVDHFDPVGQTHQTGQMSPTSQPAQAKPAGNVCSVSLGDEQCEISVASPYAFRLHIFPTGSPAAPPSVFLASHDLSSTTLTLGQDGSLTQGNAIAIRRQGSIVAFQTGFGAVEIDTGRKMWSLLDGAGTVLADWAPIGQGTPMTISSGSTPAQPQPLYYGSGSSPNLGALTQTKSESKQGNGSSNLPQFWSNAGYGELMISQDDLKPGSWTSNASGGVDWTVPGSTVDLYVMPAATLDKWLRADAELTGFAPVPPRWSMGYLQSRWGWKDEQYLDDTLAHFQADKLPVDAFIIDFEWYTAFPDYFVAPEGAKGFADFGWNAKLFPDPAGQLTDFASKGVKVIGIRKPRLVNADDLVMAKGKDWLMGKGTTDRINVRTLNYAIPAARDWYADKMAPIVQAGMPGFWNDEGELYYDEYSYWNMAEVEAFQKVKPQDRFWSINRALAPGLQRFGAATWTGDISPNWATLQITPGQLLAYSLAGMPYATCDVGGFAGETNAELLVRWMQAAVFFPVMRCHSTADAKPHFPWLFGQPAEDALRDALDLRYRLIPYYDSLSHENNRTAQALMRPLVMDFPTDASVAQTTDEWMMGPALLAAPVLKQGGARSVYLPAGTWYAFGDIKAQPGPQTVNVTCTLDHTPVYVRAGSLLPLGPVVQNTSEISTEPLEMQIYPGHDATFSLVEDDGTTIDYQTGKKRVTEFSWNDKTKTLSWIAGGSYAGANVFKNMKAVLFSSTGRVEEQAALSGPGSIVFQ
jgi:alpha-glucosidase